MVSFSLGGDVLVDVGRRGLARLGGVKWTEARGKCFASGYVDGDDKNAVKAVVCVCVRSRTLHRSCMDMRAQMRWAIFGPMP